MSELCGSGGKGLEVAHCTINPEVRSRTVLSNYCPAHRAVSVLTPLNKIMVHQLLTELYNDFHATPPPLPSQPIHPHGSQLFCGFILYCVARTLFKKSCARTLEVEFLKLS